jgi:thiol-disulfide isomerase/thioredoxin
MPSRILPSALIAVTSILFGCSEPLPPKAVWTGSMSLTDNRKLPFRFEMDLTGASPSVVFLNGDERTTISEVRHSGDSLIFEFPEYRAAMRGTWDGGRWDGEFFRYRSEIFTNKFESTPERRIMSMVQSPRTSIPLSGTFRVFQQTAERTDSTQIATFWVRGDSVFGTFIAADGDLGLFAGSQTGDRVSMARFTGWQASLMELRRTGLQWDVELFGRSGNSQAFRLEPRASATTIFSRQTIMKDRRKPFAFVGVTSSGDTVRSTDERFQGKALVIDIMGTWCHNCMDAAPLLQDLSTKFGPAGLEVVGLCFELKDDKQLAARNLELYQKRYGITFTVLYCGSTQDAYVDAQLKSQLNDFYAYPTTVFADRRGRVQEIHVGFRGPGTGDQYQAQLRSYHEIAARLVR